MGRRLKVGHRLLEPVVGVQFLPPQFREREKRIEVGFVLGSWKRIEDRVLVWMLEEY
jgi:hypothetical protein